MKKLLAILLVLVMLVSLAACGGGGDSAPTPAPAPAAPQPGTNDSQDPPAADSIPLLGVAVFDYANVFVSYVRQGIINYVGDRAEIQMVDAQNDQTRQNEQIAAMIQRGVDALLVNPVDPESAPVMIDMARDAGIPIIFFNRQPALEDLMAYENAWYVGVSASNQGEVQAALVMEWWAANPDADRNGDGVMQYAIIMGGLGNPDAEQRTAANIATFAGANFATELLDQQIADWQATRAMEVTETWIGRFGDTLEIILTNSGAMALGAVEAIRTHGHDIPVVGINALPAELDLIEQGYMIGSVLTDPWGQARAVVTLALNAIAGEADLTVGSEWVLTEERVVRIPDLLITLDNIHVAREVYSNVE